MKKYARIENDTVVELCQTDGNITEMFHPDFMWVDVTEVSGIKEGWVKSGANFTPPPTTPLSEIKERAWSVIKAERDHRTQTGGYKVGEKWFHSDQFSRGQQLGLVLLGANIPAGLQWKTMDGSFVTMTQQLVGQILAAGAASDQAIFAAAEAHKAAMEASADPESYDFSGGWPATFQG